MPKSRTSTKNTAGNSRRRKSGPKNDGEVSNATASGRRGTSRSRTFTSHPQTQSEPSETETFVMATGRQPIPEDTPRHWVPNRQQQSTMEGILGTGL